MIISVIITLLAQGKVKSAYSRYSNIASIRGITGAEAARKILEINGMANMPIYEVDGNLTDNYNPSSRTMNLSQEVYRGRSLASLAIAAHEAGHAIQHHNNYLLLLMRNVMAKPVGFVSNFSWIMILVGMFLMYRIPEAGSGYSIGLMIFDVGIIFFCGAVLFHMVTLPVEIDASSRALKILTEEGLIEDSERKGVKALLGAAALTYVAALATSVLQLIRLFLIRGNR